MTPTTTTDTATIVRYDVITTGGNAINYRGGKFPQIVARRDRDGVLSDIEVVVSWAGHEGREPIYGSNYTVEVLTAYADGGDPYGEVFGFDGLMVAIADADHAALTALIRWATAAHTKAVSSSVGTVDTEAVRATVAAALGVEPHPGIPTTRDEADEWRLHFTGADFVKIVPA